MKKKTCAFMLAVLLSFHSLAFCVQIPIANPSFEDPVIDPNGFGVIPYLDAWTELDRDLLGSTNTGAFINTPEGSPDRLVNADGLQLAFLGSQQGNGLLQQLDASFAPGCVYRLSAGLGISWRFPPSTQDRLSLVFFYQDGSGLRRLASHSVGPHGLGSDKLAYAAAYLVVPGGDKAVGKRIGIGILAEGQAGGFWVIDAVKVDQWFAVDLPVLNSSFELPKIDPSGPSMVSYVGLWRPLAIDTPDVGVMAAGQVLGATGWQVAYIADRYGNGLWQDIDAKFIPGCSYILFGSVGTWPQQPPLNAGLELGLYARGTLSVLDLGTRSIPASQIASATLTKDAFLLDVVQQDAQWAGDQIGIMIRGLGSSGGYWLIDDVSLFELMPDCITIPNGSFEEPVIDPCGFGVVPYVGVWTELDCDRLGSTNTGAFINTPEGSPDRLVNADGLQLAFLGSQKGNGLEQVLEARYEPGCLYRLKVGVGISWRFPPAQKDRLELVFFCDDDAGRHDIAATSISPIGLTSDRLQQFVLYLNTGHIDPWLGRPIGIGIRANGQPGGFWVLDDVQLGLSKVNNR